MARILVADDDLSQRELVQRVLRVAGHTVHTVADGAQAMAELEHAPYDLLVTDVYMPVMDGIELLTHCRERYPQLALLAASGGDVIVDQRRLEASGLLDNVEFIEKPFKVEELRDAVGRALGQG